MRLVLMMFALAILLVPARAPAQARKPIVSTLDVHVGAEPSIVTIAGRRHLVHELHLTNFAAADVTLTRLQVLDAATNEVIADLSGDALASHAGPPGVKGSADTRVIPPGSRAVTYLWVPLADRLPPSRIRHRIAVHVVRQGRRIAAVFEGAVASVRPDPPIVLGPPLRGGPWVALYDPLLEGGHRRAIFAIDGRARIPARFAIDFVRLDMDGNVASGDRSLTANWHGFGAEVIAVADATVVEASDDIPEAPSLPTGPRSPLPLENVSGNYVALDLGGGRYAFYEHLKHGSVRVEPGDRVKSGDVLGLLGNSGGSSAGPHLHFHVADAGAELAAEGVSYAFAGFESVGRFERIGDFLTGVRWQSARDGEGGTRRRELPGPNAVIIFR